MDKYLALAAGYTSEAQPRLLIAHGLSGSGKTYVSRRLAEQVDIVHLRSDVERKRLFGLSPLESSRSGPGSDIYSTDANTRTYARLGELAGQLLDSGWSVLVDAAFLKREEREVFCEIGVARGVPFAIMHCEADIAVQRERVAARTGDASEADLAILDLQLERQEPLADAEAAAVIHVDTTGDPDLGPLLVFMA